MDKLLIFPCNGNAVEALDCAAGQFEVIGFIDDDPEKTGVHRSGVNVYGRYLIEKYPEAKVLAVPGSPRTFGMRKRAIDSLNLPPARFARVIHARATISPMAVLGYNILIMAGVVITSNAEIGNHICILPNTVVHHDSAIEDYCLIGSNITIAGYTKVQANCYIGSGSNIINGIVVGRNSLIGLGTNVIKSIPDSSIAVGNPARITGTTGV